ncbi:hypothetical protein SDRG_09831 [Saprolegnia diclina VS20]|uniref:Copper transport protein n=1 Tax=Saprolegnia diclina (strain VS20) TaxID=1156394 RepID=T0QG02_SAPDV|nr:hypothetical protein SDRG_09831 [Saprolegnia diclina VS20]EQC32505.1 hypothetical protein SDRG_09831 [Saprolegnia diclina VS20]|eukprot:XP_008614006.1 hypothetical protein SDRG_09831 [Saprolegnia diclina VS20]
MAERLASYGVVLLLVCVVTSFCTAHQVLEETYCPLCNMVVIPELNQTWEGNQAIYGCEMAGHMDLLRTLPESILRSPEVVDPHHLPEPYASAGVACPVCGSPHVHVSMSWGYQGNQKLFACSEAHAKLIKAQPSAYYTVKAPSTRETPLCEHSTVMFDGFQSFVGSSCPKLFLPTWVLSSELKYALGFALVVLIGILVEWLGEFREDVEKRMLHHYAAYEACRQATPSLPTSKRPSTPPVRLPLWCEIVLSVLYMLALTLGYLLMLVAMLYETGLFVAAILGLGAGFYLFKDTEQAEMSGNIDPCCST